MSSPVLGPFLVGMMIALDQGPLEVEAMGEVIERTAMMMNGMRELISEGTVMRNAIENIILWYIFTSLFCVQSDFLWVYMPDNFISMIFFCRPHLQLLL